jgi:Short C-terminal domain
MFVRRRPLMRAAVVGGGAYVAGRHMANRQAEAQAAEDDQNARLDQLEQQQGGYPQQGAPPPQGYGGYPQQAAPPPPPAAPAGEPSMMDQLSKLADLHNQGVLTDEEFAAAKAKLIG